MSNVPNVSIQTVVDTILFFVLCGPLLALNLLGMPVTTGFWCHDESISLPYKPDSISKPLLLVMGFGGPFFVIVLTESIRAAAGSKKTWPLKAQLKNIAKAYGVFIFGMAADCIFTEMLKYSVGRLRPHFFDVCKPNFDQVNCSSVIWPKVRSELFRHKEPVVLPTENQTSTLLDPTHACADVGHYDAVMVVHSATGHFKHRADYRDTYGNKSFTQPYSIKVIFILGVPTTASVQTKVELEHMLYEDTMQANFVDTYQNLSYKAVAALRWLVEKCPGAPLVIKMDDDVLLDVHRFFEEFVPPSLYHNDLLVHCHMWEAAEAARSGKWRVTKRQYSLDTFPDYCSGFFVLLSMAAVEELYHAALETPILWVDDVYIYGLVRESTQDVQVLYLDQVSYSEKTYNSCVRLYGYRFVEDYECTNKLVDPKLLRDSRLSFPSGHASVSVYSALFTVFYLQLRMELGFSHLLRPLVQLCLVMLATFCCVSRITDHKHFVSDIAAGAAIGSIVAWLAFYKLGMRIIPESPPVGKPRVLPRAMSVESEPQTPTPLLRPAAYVQEKDGCSSDDKGSAVQFNSPTSRHSALASSKPEQQ